MKATLFAAVFLSIVNCMVRTTLISRIHLSSFLIHDFNYPEPWARYSAITFRNDFYDIISRKLNTLRAEDAYYLKMIPSNNNSQNFVDFVDVVAVVVYKAIYNSVSLKMLADMKLELKQKAIQCIDNGEFINFGLISFADVALFKIPPVAPLHMFKGNVLDLSRTGIDTGIERLRGLNWINTIFLNGNKFKTLPDFSRGFNGLKNIQIENNPLCLDDLGKIRAKNTMKCFITVTEPSKLCCEHLCSIFKHVKLNGRWVDNGSIN